MSAYETAMEKWVGLTRRIAAIERFYHADEATLIRHVYDIAKLYQANTLDRSFYALATGIMCDDRLKFQKSHPEYAINPYDEIRISLSILSQKLLWRDRYEVFIAAMVYDNKPELSYDAAIKILEKISKEILDNNHM